VTIIDVHSHWGTKRGYPLRTEEELAQQRATWNSAPNYATEAEMADYFRASGVRVILDFGFAKFRPLEEMRALHDYAFETERAHRDVILGHWIHVDPRMGTDGVSELRRCIDKRLGFVGFAVSASLSPPASDPAYDPYYRLCIEANIPVLIFVGTTGLGAGLPGGGGVILDHCHPRNLDFVAATYPNLKIVAARPGWPWQAETIAVLMHKRSIWYELHGWSPKYHSPELKHEIPRRLKDRILFAADYPLFTYERLVRDWRAEGYPEAVLENLFRRNAEAFFASLGQTWTSS
jgi:predicted TIM-barrel fold metal-dependent hydrolase